MRRVRNFAFLILVGVLLASPMFRAPLGATEPDECVPGEHYSCASTGYFGVDCNGTPGCCGQVCDSIADVCEAFCESFELGVDEGSSTCNGDETYFPAGGGFPAFSDCDDISYSCQCYYFLEHE